MFPSPAAAPSPSSVGTAAVLAAGPGAVPRSCRLGVLPGASLGVLPPPQAVPCPCGFPRPGTGARSAGEGETEAGVGGGGGRSHGLDQGRGWGQRGSLAAWGPGAAPDRVPAAGGCCAARWCCPPPNRAAALQPPSGPCPEPAGLGAEVPRAHPGRTARSLSLAALEGPCRSRNLRPQKLGGPLAECPHSGHVPPSRGCEAFVCCRVRGNFLLIFPVQDLDL